MKCMGRTSAVGEGGSKGGSGRAVRVHVYVAYTQIREDMPLYTERRGPSAPFPNIVSSRLPHVDSVYNEICGTQCPQTKRRCTYVYIWGPEGVRTLALRLGIGLAPATVRGVQ